MKKILLLSIVLVSVIACGGKKVANTTISVNAGALIAGSTPLGGVFITGTNGVDKFSLGANASQAQNLVIDLPFGDWKFAAVAWLNQASTGPMTGKTRCGVGEGTIQGSDATISLNLTQADCTLTTFGAPAFQESISYGEATFKKLQLESCLNPVGITTGFCDGTTLGRLPGEHISFRLEIASYSSFAANLPRLSSACYNVANINSGFVATELRLPTSLGVRFPLSLVGYEKADCNGSDSHRYVFAAAPGQVGVEKIQVANGTDSYRFVFADNYIGVTGSAFFPTAVQASNTNLVKLPNITCVAPGTGTCLNKTTNAPYDKWTSYDEARRGLWNLFGSNDLVDPDDYIPSGSSFGSFSNGGTGLFTVTAFKAGSVGNKIEVSFTSGALAGTASASCNGNKVFVDHSATTLPSVIVGVINGEASCASLVTASVGTDLAGLFTAPSNLTGGTDIIVAKRRHNGRLNDIRDMLIGPIGALLFKNGITTDALMCSSSGTYYFQLPGEQIALTLGAATSLANHPNFSTTPANDFEKKILISINGIAEQAFYFNCNDAIGNDDLGVGAHVSYELNATGSSAEQVFWDVTTEATAKFEYSSKYRYNYNSYTHWSYDLFEKTVAGDSWKYWSIKGSDEFASYRRLAAVANGTDVSVRSQAVAANESTITSFIGAGDEAWTVATGVSGTAVTLSDPIYPAPNTAPSFKMGDIIFGTTFWPLSN